MWGVGRIQVTEARQIKRHQEYSKRNVVKSIGEKNKKEEHPKINEGSNMQEETLYKKDKEDYNDEGKDDSKKIHPPEAEKKKKEWHFKKEAQNAGRESKSNNFHKIQNCSWDPDWALFSGWALSLTQNKVFCHPNS